MNGWSDPAWRAEAHAWIAGQLVALEARRTAPIEQPHVRPWATVMRVPTDTGDLFFKANAPELRHEAGLAELLARRHPDCVPPLLATDPGRGWMLMGDAGTPLRASIARERDLGRWLDVLPLYARVQVDLAGHVDELLALGVPHVPLAALPERYEGLVDSLDGIPAGEQARLRALTPLVRELCDELAAHGLPETLQHDDLHDGQVYERDGRLLVLDWGDACVSHPFFTLSVTLEGVIAWGLDDVRDSVDTTPFRDAYLRPWREALPDVDLDAAVAIASRLGWACRAVNGHVEGDDGPTHARLRMFADRHP